MAAEKYVDSPSDVKLTFIVSDDEDEASTFAGSLAELEQFAFEPSVASPRRTGQEASSSSGDLTPAPTACASGKRPAAKSPARPSPAKKQRAVPTVTRTAPAPLDQLGPVSEYMRSLTSNLQRIEAIEIHAQLDLDKNPLGFGGSTTFSTRHGALGDFAVRQKARHPKSLVLLQKGSFYELVGIDAVVGVEFLGLNPMGGRAEIGIPNSYVQNYLNRLCVRNITASVYEETEGGVVGQPKKRELVQTVSPANPILFSRHTVGDTFLTTPGALNILIAFPSSNGSSSIVDLFAVDAESKEIKVKRGLIASKARVLLSVCNAGVCVVGNVSPVVYKDVPSVPEFLGFSARASKLAFLTETVLPRKYDLLDASSFCVHEVSEEAGSHPVHGLTARALGIAGNVPDGTPKLLDYITDCATPVVRKTLRQHILHPTKARREANREAIRELLEARVSLPCKVATDPKRTLAVLAHVGHVKPPVVRLLADNLNVFVMISTRTPALFRALLRGALLDVHMDANAQGPSEESMIAEASRLHRRLGGIFVKDRKQTAKFNFVQDGAKVNAFVEKCEGFKIDFHRESLVQFVEAVDAAFYELLSIMNRDFRPGWQSAVQPINGILSFKQKTKIKPATALKEIHVHKIGSKETSKQFTSVDAHGAFLSYKAACENADAAAAQICADVASNLRGSLGGLLMPIVLSLATNYSALYSHCRACRDWKLGSLMPETSDELCAIEGLIPFWLPSSESVANNVTFTRKMAGIILTGINAGGKSTLLRSIAACAVLHNAGLLIPCQAMRGGFDNVFLKIGNSDDALQRKSNFVNETSELSDMLRGSEGSDSVFLLDELLRGTSTLEGASLAGALCEEMDRLGKSFILSTHFHELYDQQLTLPHTRFCRMKTGASGEKTFQMEEGKCLDTQAFQTAADCGLPPALVQRALAIARESDHAPTKPALPICVRCPDDDPRRHDVLVLIPALMASVVGTDPIIMFADEEPPPMISLAVYVLVDSSGAAYVGETKDLGRRLSEHRASNKVKRDSRIFLCDVASKSKGLTFEKALIKGAEARGITLVSYCDGNHKN